MKRNIIFYYVILFTLFLLNSLLAKNAPDFTFNTIDGNEISLSDYKGKVVIVNFWATKALPFSVPLMRMA